MAFYREGLSLEQSNIAYATLSFFKILNIVAPTYDKQKTWINGNIQNFGTSNYTKHEVDRRCAELRATGVSDIGKYLYVSCRCAVAHAGTTPTVDPESPEDLERLFKDLPLIRAMAAHVIEHELGIKSLSTIYREHLYELAGFKPIFGGDLIAKVIQGNMPRELENIDLPTMNVEIRGKAPYGPLTNMLPIAAGYEIGMIGLVLQSPDKRGRISFKLDFSKERLHFELSDDLEYRDDGTAEAAEFVAEINRFFRDYFANGRLHIYDADTGALISRKDFFLPMNVMLDFEASEREIAHWKRVAAQRRKRSTGVENEIIQWSAPYHVNISVSFNFEGII